jgi:V/A-type H+/Na+-transporting ATPase subunit I
MIAQMKKYSFLIYHREYDEFLENLRNLGVVHLIEKQGDVTDDIRDQYQLIDRVDKTIRFLNKREVEQKESSRMKDGEAIYTKINELQTRLEHHQHTLANIQKEMNELQPWGNFSMQILNQLRENHIDLKFYVTPLRKFEANWHESYTLEIISQSGGNLYFVVILREGEEADLAAEEFRFPKHSLADLQAKHAELLKENSETEKTFDEYAASGIPALEKFKNQLLENVEYEKARYHTSREAEERLMIVEGWVPSELEEKVRNYLEKTGTVYITSAAQAEEKVPILLKNKRFSKKFEMLGDLYSLPKYNELDLTPFFAPFYTLFFGFCLGDTGYGLLMVFASMFARKRVKKELKPVLSLVFYLGLSTIFFGLIGGTFFGINLYETNLPIYSSLQEMMSTKNTDINQILFYLSLALGGVQILFGMVLKAINEIIQFGWKLAMGTIGWIVLLLGLVVIAVLNQLTGMSMDQLRPFLYSLLAVSGVLILFLNNLKRNILMNLGVGLWNSYNMVTGVLGDLLSYIRLFALGISSAILGYVFNSLALSVSGSILGIFFMVIILVIGHSINLFMSGLGAFVHPMRLTFVEFYKNAGFAGGGKKYNPFRKLV